MTVESVLAHGLKTSVFGSQWNAEYGDNLALLDPDRIKSDLLANRPAAGAAHRFFFATDNQKLYYDTGAAWVEQSTAAAAHAATHAGGGADPVTLAQSQVVNLAADLAGKEPANANIQAHIASAANPHTVTKAQVGLGNVDNTSDANKPVSTATQTALGLKANDSAVPHLAGNESIGGTKTFSSAPVFSAGVTGVTDGSSAAAGIVGQIVTATPASAVSVPTSPAYVALCTLNNLPAGRWRLTGYACRDDANAVTGIFVGINTSVSCTTEGVDFIACPAANGAANGTIVRTFSTAAATTYYLVVRSLGATATMYGSFFAERIG